MPPPANNESVAALGDELPDNWENQYLGHGAKAEWKASGIGVLDSAGENDVGKIIIQGAEDRDITVKANFRAVIGPLNKSLPELTFEIPEGGSVEIPVDMRFALGMHEKQSEYNTRIHAEFFAKEDDGSEIQYFQSLDPRYLATNEKTGSQEIMDIETRDERYPFGFTTEAGQELVARKVAASEARGAILEAIGPGIATYADDSAVQD